MKKAQVVSIEKILQGVTFLPDRKPGMTGKGVEGAFATLGEYRDGGIFVGHYAGLSEWERHPADEIVMVLEGQTTLFILEGEDEKPNILNEKEMIVVPEGTWHRFETPKGVKILSVTPQPTDHRISHPLDPAAD
ncbi:cupin domain-containing protein [Aestuariispira insulae]|uniref:Mannose-6-phosphate isomerase-like protein (Cupin superfamily) n=1 Tax=Aestuariispira insulae TaxID=1461337 RepID=A0A3D9HK16_9PROT|nr:cupin domain-containing protein [Aestuariispira insulae]RED49818.1 mannose-6-phosphate isomerase-like protein (cupin superfamily) [Aestuariispira insulae]